MAEILVGLTNNKTSFWDPNTKTYLTLAEKTKTVRFDENDANVGKHLERICHGLFASNPAIYLYEGKIPEAAMEHWKAKFTLTGLNIAKNRADKLNAKSAVVANDEVVAQSVKPAATTQEKEAVEVAEVQEEAPAKTTRKKAATSK